MVRLILVYWCSFCVQHLASSFSWLIPYLFAVVFFFPENDIYLIITAEFQEHAYLTNLHRYRCTELVQRADKLDSRGLLK